MGTEVGRWKPLSADPNSVAGIADTFWFPPVNQLDYPQGWGPHYLQDDPFHFSSLFTNSLSSVLSTAGPFLPHSE